MSDLTPIHDGEAEHYAREFFRREFVNQRLGRPGQWQGELARKLRLENPVAPRVFGDLLKGITPEGDHWVTRPQRDATRVQGWRFSLAEGRETSLLYGLSPTLVRARIRLAHNEAVRAALRDFEHTLSDTSWLRRPFESPAKHALFAKFQSGVSREQMPELATTVFLVNLIYRRGGGVEEYQPQQLANLLERTQKTYQQTFDQAVTRALGARVKLPQKLFSELHAAMPKESIYSRRSTNEQAHGGEQFFAIWQDRARDLGWGSEKTVAALREAKLSPTWHNWMESWSRKWQYEKACSSPPTRRPQSAQISRDGDDSRPQLGNSQSTSKVIPGRRRPHDPLKFFTAMQRGPKPNSPEKVAKEPAKEPTKPISKEPPKPEQKTQAQDKWTDYTH